jgi:glucosamine--fructose-6-phosphate aminotransferase (isomerizing)
MCLPDIYIESRRIGLRKRLNKLSHHALNMPLGIFIAVRGAGSKPARIVKNQSGWCFIIINEVIMCGIVGYVGHQKAEPILLSGLQKLEYRGYDSAGLAFLHGHDLQVVRSEGKLNRLAEKLRLQEWPANLGIGHTRWATHGRPNETNAHPHASQDVVLVHNGIIENYRELKEQLEKKGYQFSSETDTEVVSHLLQDEKRTHSDKSFLEVFKSTLGKLRGAYSLVVIDIDHPEEIFIAKTSSPLVIGRGKGENFVASDIPALLPYTREMLFLDDGQYGVISKDDVKVFDFSGNVVNCEFRQIHWSASQAEKGGYKHFMIKEIMEQPRALADTLAGRLTEDRSQVTFGEELDKWLKEFSDKEGARIEIIACGTSWHAGLVGRYWIENLAGIPVSVELASEYRYRKPLLTESTLIIPISQSGETIDTLVSVKESQKQNTKVLSICNVMESSIPRVADHTIYTQAGPEVGVASTKAFVTQLGALYLLALKLAELKSGSVTPEMKARIDALMALPQLIETHLPEFDKKTKSLAEKIYKDDHTYFLGRGLQYPIVLEGALKLKEISYIHAEGYAGGEMKHGPIALIEDGIPVVATMLKDSLYDKMVSNVKEIEARGGEVIPLVSEDDESLKSQYSDFISTPNTHEDLLPFLSVIPLQLLAYHVADRKGTDVDQPRNLAKSVTVE